MSDFVQLYLEESRKTIEALDVSELDSLAKALSFLTDSQGRLFVIGVGGSAATAAHAVNDLRKICGIEAYSPCDNVAELTARVNDDGWESSFAGWLKVSKIRAGDAVLVFSVGGGNVTKRVSMNIVRALELAKSSQAKIFGIVGRDGGVTRAMADVCVVIPAVSPERITPHTEGVCGVILHLIVSHPALMRSLSRWETVDQQSGQKPTSFPGK